MTPCIYAPRYEEAFCLKAKNGHGRFAPSAFCLIKMRQRTTSNNTGCTLLSVQLRRLYSDTCSFWRFSYVARPVGPTSRQRSIRGLRYSRVFGPFRLGSEGQPSCSSSRLPPDEGYKHPQVLSVLCFLCACS